MGTRRKLWKYDFSGSCAPGNSEAAGNKTFSVGIFRWVSNGKGGLKKSGVVYRVRGKCSNAEAVFKRAGNICGWMDEGWEPLQKSETV